MSKSKKPFIVRGFNTTVEGAFDCRDVLTKFGSFTEVSVDKQHDAVVEMTTNSNIHTMSARNIVITNQTEFPYSSDSTRELYVLDLTIVTNALASIDLRSSRSAIRDVLKLWAEKSRIKGRRGWRANAIKTPTFEYDPKLNCAVIKTQIILSTAILYDQNTATINVTFDYSMEQEDLQNLHRALVRALGGLYSHIKYRHTVIGDGEVV